MAGEKCINVKAETFDAPNLIYEFHDGRVASTWAVRDRGCVLAVDGDAPTYAALLEAPIDPGHVRTCSAEGLLRLGGMPDGAITVDFVLLVEDSVEARLIEIRDALKEITKLLVEANRQQRNSQRAA